MNVVNLRILRSYQKKGVSHYVLLEELGTSAITLVFWLLSSQYEWKTREKLTCWRRRYILCQIWSSPSKVCLCGKNYAKAVFSVWIYIVLTSKERISACQHPEAFLALNANWLVPVNCPQPPPDVPSRNRCSGLWTASCLLVPLWRNENNFKSGFSSKVAVVHAEFVSVSSRVGCQEDSGAATVVAIRSSGWVLS